MVPMPQSQTGVNRMGSLTGKVAVVTGSTSGIGLGYARAFAGAGANVVLNGMGAQADVENQRSAIERDFGVKAVYSAADKSTSGMRSSGSTFPPRSTASVQP